ncbi:hypothetical protein CLIB1444_07S02212 [[Candida] jaroonii]|uniref:Uncharacterized protein n=1 Tax=[Candida] jaroonii TaxID=467808 RepID=A0ACA9Y9P2_9ASCO|nr:hypothetical protein CLIB1444_07S02212 [[Candida] jaroonii]
MFPRDRYRSKQGEFLRIHKEEDGIGGNEIQLINLDDSSIILSSVSNPDAPPEPREGMTREEIELRYRIQSQPLEPQQTLESHESHEPFELNTSGGCQCECHGVGQEIDAKLQKPGKKRFFNFSERLTRILVPSPIIEIESALVTPQDQTENDENLPVNSPYKLPQKLLGSIENLLSEKPLKNDFRRHSYAEGTFPSIVNPNKAVYSNNGSDLMIYGSLREQSIKQKEVWKTVLNDISLSAARLSTGGTPVNAEEFSNLTSDFVNSKIYEDVISMYNYTD